MSSETKTSHTACFSAPSSCGLQASSWHPSPLKSLLHSDRRRAKEGLVWPWLCRLGLLNLLPHPGSPQPVSHHPSLSHQRLLAPLCRGQPLSLWALSCFPKEGFSLCTTGMKQGDNWLFAPGPIVHFVLTSGPSYPHEDRRRPFPLHRRCESMGRLNIYI